MISKHILLITFLNKPKLIFFLHMIFSYFQAIEFSISFFCLHTVKCQNSSI